MRTAYGLSVLALGLALATCSECPPPAPPPDDSFDCAAVAQLETDEVLTVDDPVEGQYIVTFKRAPAAATVAAKQEAMAQAVESFGGRDAVYFSTSNQALVTLDELEGVRGAMADGQVLFVEQVGTKFIPEPDELEAEPGAETEPAPEAVETWGIDRVDQRDLPLDGLAYNPSGNGLLVHAYVLDTGVDLHHAEFTGRVGACFSAYGGACDVDTHGHGTHVSGTVLGSTWGVARQATLHNVQVLQGGSGTDATVIAGIDWATANCLENDWKCVGNMSLGGGNSVSLDTALCRSINLGMAWAVAAGNDDQNACSSSPARVRQAVTAAASDIRDDKAWFSNHGPCVDLVAPGLDIESARRGGGSTTMSGTSMASPHAAGGLAICAQAGQAPRDCVLASSTPDKIDGLEPGTPNKLLYVGN